jgi:hypothetical protein
MENVRVKKLTLDLDELAVESFDASPSLQDQRGTVKGQSGYYETCWSCGEWCEYSETWGTCYDTCYTCGASCNPYTCPTRATCRATRDIQGAWTGRGAARKRAPVNNVRRHVLPHLSNATDEHANRSAEARLTLSLSPPTCLP